MTLTTHDDYVLIFGKLTYKAVFSALLAFIYITPILSKNSLGILMTTLPTTKTHMDNTILFGLNLCNMSD